MTLRKTLRMCLVTNIPFFVILTRDKQKWDELQNTIMESVVHLEKQNKKTFIPSSFILCSSAVL